MNRNRIFWSIFLVVGVINFFLYKERANVLATRNAEWERQKAKANREIAAAQTLSEELRERVQALPPKVGFGGEEEMTMFRFPSNARHLLNLRAVTSKHAMSDDIASLLKVTLQERAEVDRILSKTIQDLKAQELLRYETDEERITVPPFLDEGLVIGREFESHINESLGPERGLVFFNLARTHFNGFGEHKTTLSFSRSGDGGFKFEVLHFSSDGDPVGGEIVAAPVIDNEEELLERYPRYGHLFGAELKRKEK